VLGLTVPSCSSSSHAGLEPLRQRADATVVHDRRTTRQHARERQEALVVRCVRQRRGCQISAFLDTASKSSAEAVG